MSKELDQLRQKRDKAERELHKAQNDEKALAHELSRLTRAERTHRLCNRGGMLETFLREPLLLTDNDGKEILSDLFYGEAAQPTIAKRQCRLLSNDRQTLWNAVEGVECQWNFQLAKVSLTRGTI